MLNGKPLILCTTDGEYMTSDPRRRVLTNPLCYSSAIQAAGGIPIHTCELCGDEMADLCDGLLLTGGGSDLNPKLFGQERLFDNVKLDDARDAFEIPVLKRFLEQKKPILGICHGFQLINVVLGGTLYQDLAEQLGYVHMNRDIRHPVYAEAGSVLHRLFGPEFRVNSTHHQAVRDVAPGLRVTARSVEGIAEAYEHESLPVMATQFHPERLTGILWDDRTPDFAPLFRHFIGMAEQSAKGR